STDFANVSQLVPAALVAVASWPQDVVFHTPEAVAAAREPMALEAMLTAAKAMALTGLDLLREPALLSSVRSAFAEADAAPGSPAAERPGLSRGAAGREDQRRLHG